ncbi:MAG: hypothetical protein LH615_09280 [Ferruginibacter sp.]|nr:hypothetical protein [Ferruginibacter sp.]
MKKIILFFIISIFSLATMAQNEKYVNAMKKNITQLDSAFAKPETFLSLANTFERIGLAENAEWLPYYYAAYCRVNYAFMQKDQAGNDAIADKATELINKADSLQPNNSEISCIKSMIASVHMMVNPQQRFMEYGTISQKAMAMAIQQDASNPRPYMLKGQSLKYTPEQFGGGCKKAVVEFTVAKEKYNVFKPASDISPNWGESYTEMMIKECGEAK